MKIGDKVTIVNALKNSHGSLHPENCKFQGLKGTITATKKQFCYDWVVRFKNNGISWTIDQFDNGDVTWWFNEEDLKLQALQLEFSFMEAK